MSEWISIEDKRPPLGVEVLVSRDNIVRSTYAKMVNNGIGWQWSNQPNEATDPRRFYTHWQPLPPPVSPRLTVKEALMEAIECLEEMNPLHYGRVIKFRGREIIPRLRAALEAE